jgi:hypothetical protein
MLLHVRQQMIFADAVIFMLKAIVIIIVKGAIRHSGTSLSSLSLSSG